MYGCDLLFTPETAREIKAELRDKMGACPCDMGKRCPLLPADLTPLLPTPEMRKIA